MFNALIHNGVILLLRPPGDIKLEILRNGPNLNISCFYSAPESDSTRSLDDESAMRDTASNIGAISI